MKICTNDRMVSRAVLKLWHQGFYFYLSIYKEVQIPIRKHCESHQSSWMMKSLAFPCWVLQNKRNNSRVFFSWLWQVTSPGPSSLPSHQTGLAFACARHLGLHGNVFACFWPNDHGRSNCSTKTSGPRRSAKTICRSLAVTRPSLPISANAAWHKPWLGICQTAAIEWVQAGKAYFNSQSARTCLTFRSHVVLDLYTYK